MAKAKTPVEKVKDTFNLRGSNPEHALFALMLMTAVAVTAVQLDKGDTPHPRNYVAFFAVYLVLAFMAEFGREPARLAVAIAAVTLLTYAVSKGSSFVSIARKISKASGGPTPMTAETWITPLTPIDVAPTGVTMFGEVVG